MNFKEERIGKITAIEQILKKYLPVKEGLQKEIMEAMEYSLLAGGKRLRPMLMRETYVLFGGDEELIEPFISLSDAFIDGIRQITSLDMYFLPDFNENDGHARILADRDHISSGDLKILLKLI